MSFDPIQPWSPIACGILATSLLVFLIRGLVDRWRVLNPRPLLRSAAIGLTLIAFLLLGVSALNPHRVRTSDPETFRLSVLFDVSDSTLRSLGGWPAIRSRAHDFLVSSLDAIPSAFRNDGRGSIMTFREQALTVRGEIPVVDLPAAVNGLDEHQFATGQGTDIAAGLAAAEKANSAGGGRSAVLLVSDGHQTRGDALDAAKSLARRGIAVHVLPIESGAPDIALIAADLPPQIQSGTQSHLRGVIRNAQPTEAEISLILEISKFSLTSQDKEEFSHVFNRRVSLPAGEWRRLRWPLTFTGFGIHHADLTLNGPDGNNLHRRRLFTQVKRKPNILAIGGDNRWVSAISPETARVHAAGPEDLGEDFNFEEYDAAVIGAVPAERFSAGTLAIMAKAVTSAGMGLMLINGGHHGRDQEAPTVLMSYNDTPLEPLLPLSSRPRPFEKDPPSRQVVVMMDASGSMGGWRLQKSKEIAVYVVGTLLRPQDRLDLILFSTGANHLVENRAMDDLGKRDAIHRILSVEAGGGTDPSEALELLASRRMTHCGLIFISDGEFDRVTYRPDCRATVFAIGHATVPNRSPLWDFADPFPVAREFNPASISMPYFEVKPRNKFFESGSFKPLTMERFLSRSEKLPVPDLSLEGAAVTTAKEDARLVAVRPKLTDPVLAYGQSGEGTVAVFTSELADSWLTRPEGARAINAWLSRLLGYTARDRYDFRVEDLGFALELEVSLVAHGNRLPRVQHLSAGLSGEGKSFSELPLRADPAIPGTFRGHIQTPDDLRGKKLSLVLTESGVDALNRPQRIPFHIPAGGQGMATLPTEAFSYGTNTTLLREIASVTGGRFDPSRRDPLFRPRPTFSKGKPLWAWFVIAGLAAYLCAIGFQRWNP